jgi:hypothetical protein
LKDGNMHKHFYRRMNPFQPWRFCALAAIVLAALGLARR